MGIASKPTCFVDESLLVCDLFGIVCDTWGIVEDLLLHLDGIEIDCYESARSALE